MRSIVTDLDRALCVDFDPVERLKVFPAGATLKGMFFGRMAGLLRSEWNTMSSNLRAAPRLGSYLPFTDYPLEDYGRLTIAAARKLHPRESLAQAIRLLGRETVHTFAESTVGRVMVRMFPDLKGALLKIPEVQRMVVGMGRVRASDTGPREVVIEFEDVATWIDCGVVGNLEGTVLMFGERPTIELEPRSAANAVLTVRW